MGKTMLGFDIGSDRLKIFATDRNGARFHEVRLPERIVENGVVVMPNAFSNYLKKLRKDLNLPRGKAALAIPSGQTICRFVAMPRMTEDQLLLNLPYEFSDFINGEPDRYFCDYALCEPREEDNTQEDEERMSMMAAIISKEQSNSYVRMFAQAGIKLELMLPQEMCLLQLTEQYRRANPDAPREYCFVDLGHTATRVTLISGDRVQAVRQIAIGGQNLDKIVADVLAVDEFLADSYKRTNFQGILDHPRAREFYGSIAVELLKVFNFYQYAFRGNNLNGIYLTGGGANVQPLRQVIADTLGVTPYHPWDLLTGDLKRSGFGNEDKGAVGILATSVTMARGAEK